MKQTLLAATFIVGMAGAVFAQDGGSALPGKEQWDFLTRHFPVPSSPMTLAQDVALDESNKAAWIVKTMVDAIKSGVTVPTPRSAADIEDQIYTALYGFLRRPDVCEKSAPIRTHSSIIGTSCIIAVGVGALRNATILDHTIAIGRCAGATLLKGNRMLLIGDYTSAPEGADGFVNIANQVCFWRDTGEVVPCPPPELECAK